MTTYTITITADGLSPSRTTVDRSKYERIKLVNEHSEAVLYTIAAIDAESAGLATRLSSGETGLESMPSGDSELKLTSNSGGVHKVTLKVSSSPTPGPGISGPPTLPVDEEDDEPIGG